MDAEGFAESSPCPECGSEDTITYHYREGFTELECRACHYRSDRRELSDLQRFSGDLLEAAADPELPIPIKPLKA